LTGGGIWPPCPDRTLTIYVDKTKTVVCKEGRENEQGREMEAGGNKRERDSKGNKVFRRGISRGKWNKERKQVVTRGKLAFNIYVYTYIYIYLIIYLQTSKGAKYRVSL
jgi:hypothetical protein